MVPPLGLQVSMGGGDHLLFCGPQDSNLDLSHKQRTDHSSLKLGLQGIILNIKTRPVDNVGIPIELFTTEIDDVQKQDRVMFMIILTERQHYDSFVCEYPQSTEASLRRRVSVIVSLDLFVIVRLLSAYIQNYGDAPVDRGPGSPSGPLLRTLTAVASTSINSLSASVSGAGARHNVKIRHM
ncbi:hypothetical protein EVAR_48108_1 [Eumeta japonica]|uniref:Uncharacterized protein n=1 Tax=Eumeta variegata TaxID=151549 RepID=A0A4C1XNQ9_EUMVA|nr:hypothetical protein EVAR_48108_1 [Eumeta japonica]